VIFHVSNCSTKLRDDQSRHDEEIMIKLLREYYGKSITNCQLRITGTVKSITNFQLRITESEYQLRLTINH